MEEPSSGRGAGRAEDGLEARDGTGGFTLVEVLIAVAVFGILAGIAYPALSPGRSQLDASLGSLGSTIMRAQRLAVTRQHDVAVTFRVDRGTWVMHEDADNDGSIDSGERTVARSLGDGVVYGQRDAADHAVGGGPVTFDSRDYGDPTIVFHRSGSASEEGGIYVAATRGGGESATGRVGLLTVDRATGRTTRRVYRGGTWELYE